MNKTFGRISLGKPRHHVVFVDDWKEPAGEQPEKEAIFFFGRRLSRSAHAEALIHELTAANAGSWHASKGTETLFSSPRYPQIYSALNVPEARAYEWLADRGHVEHAAEDEATRRLFESSPTMAAFWDRPGKSRRFRLALLSFLCRMHQRLVLEDPPEEGDSRSILVVIDRLDWLQGNRRENSGDSWFVRLLSLGSEPLSLPPDFAYGRWVVSAPPRTKGLHSVYPPRVTGRAKCIRPAPGRGFVGRCGTRCRGACDRRELSGRGWG